MRQRLDGATIARALDEHYSAQLHACIRPARRRGATLPGIPILVCLSTRIMSFARKRHER
jgi:hypothetical protein